jgi:hypothetical protein
MKSSRDRAQSLVAGLVSVLIIDALETIEVNDQD